MSVEMESLVSDLIAKCYYGRPTSGEPLAPTRSTLPAARAPIG
jgi:hypothetical protein